MKGGTFMLITDKNELVEYYSGKRAWQGIPSIEVTKKGRIFSVFYSGGITEEIGNYVVLLKSDDGESFSEPIAVTYLDEHRCYDPCIWIDPLDRLWLTWGVMPDHATYAAICEDPDADELVWGEEFFVGYDVMMNKPTVLSSGEWIFPISVWDKNICIGKLSRANQTEHGPFAYITRDNGRTFERLGAPKIDKPSFDEHMILELADKRLMMLIRTAYGIGVSYSSDNGKTWTDCTDSGIAGPCSRFHIRRLKSGRVLLVNHFNYTGRNNLTALISDDDCKTWKYKLLLDERDCVSYPDVKEADDGYIYITYDRERGAFFQTWESIENAAREILMAKVTEEDIIAGKLVNEGSRLKHVISKLTNKVGFDKIPDDPYRLNDIDLANMLLTRYSGDIVGKIFDLYPVSCENMHAIETERLDALIEKLNTNDDRLRTVLSIISLVRSVSSNEIKAFPMLNSVKCIILDNVKYDLSIKEIAQKIGMSMYYMMHSFKKQTGITITEYKNQLKIAHAKTMLVNTDLSITDIALACGFGNSSYFSKLFMRYVNISPSVYRKNLKIELKRIPSEFKNIIDKDIVLYNMLDKISLLDYENLTEIAPETVFDTYAVSLPSEKYPFLHECAIIKFGSKLFAAWYNNEKEELQGRTPIRFSTSEDDGKTWSEPKIVAYDESGDILFCPPIFGVSDGKLYMMLNQMVSADHIHSLDLYLYNDTEDRFELLWSRPIPFKLNTGAYEIYDGKLMICGRTGELDGFPTIPAVLISDAGRMDSEWRIVKLQDGGTLPDNTSFVHPEPSAIINDGKIYVFVRNDFRQFQLVYLSEDNAESWSAPIIHNIAFSNSKTYSGTLSDGRNYIIGNMQPDRTRLVMLVSDKEGLRFNKRIILQDKRSENLGFGFTWHYPYACEADGRLYVIYTVGVGTDWRVRGAVVSVADIDKI